MDLRDVSSKYEDDDSDRDVRGRRYRQKGTGFFTATRSFMLFLLIIGIVIGSFVQHQYVEPLLNKEFIAENSSLQTLTKLLNEQNDKLLIDLNACRAGIAFSQSLIIASQNGLVNLTYNPENWTFNKQAEIALLDIMGIAKYKNDIVAGTKNEVLRFNSKFEKLASKEFNSVSALATDGKTIFVSADSSLIALDEQLNELDRVELLPYKAAHDILIYENTAYLLDNIMAPLFIFRVDIENPENLKIINKIEFYGINSHLNAQWLNPELNQWLVLDSYARQGGSGQIVHIYPMDKGEEALAVQQIFSASWPMESSGAPEEENEGFDVRGITAVPPIFAVVADAEERYNLAQVKSEDNNITFSNFFSLDDLDAPGEIIVRHKDDYLFIAPEIRSFLEIIDVKNKEQPKLVISKDLREYNVQAIIDIIAD